MACTKIKPDIYVPLSSYSFMRSHMELEWRGNLWLLTDECSVLTTIDVFCDGDEVALVELKVGGEHSGQLPHAVQELDEGRRHLLGVALDVAAPVHELVPEGQPVLLHEGLLRSSL